MSNITLRTVKFPGLDDTYVIPDVAETIAKHLPTETVSGSIATITDGADDVAVKDLTVSIEPSQPNDYDSVWVGGAGKNKFRPFSGGGSPVSVTVADDGTCTLSGTASSTGSGLAIAESLTLDAGTYILSDDASTNYVRFQVYNSTTGTVYWTNGTSTFTYNGTDTLTARVWYGGATAYTGMTIKPMLRLSTVSDATYEPYSNICPISGWTECNVTRLGKNLLDMSNVSEDVYINANDGTLSTVAGATTFFASVKPNTTYTFSDDQGDRTLIAGFSDVPASGDAYNTLYVNSATGVRSATFTTGNNDAYIAVYTNRYQASRPTWVQIETGSTASDYEEYTDPTTYTTDLSSAGTVYGGTLDVTSGVLTVDRAIATFDGSDDESWLWLGGANALSYIGVSGGIVTNATTQYNSYTQNNMFTDASWATRSDTGTVGMFYGASNIYVKYSEITSVAELKTLLAETPLQVVYTLATPVEYQLTPTGVRTLLGANNIYADCGTVSVTYRADLQMYIDNAISTAIT